MKTTLLRSMALALAAGATLGAQARPTPQHKHYERPAEFDQAADPGKPVAPRLQNLGTHVFPITTEIPRAQVFMNQGLNLAWAFNHAEAARSFAEVARLDPMNPMAYWGHALVLGPNINASMEAADEPKALELAKKAQSLASRATPRERAYISALTARYTGNPADRGKANRAFSDAMRSVVAAFPNDNDARAMFAESLMNLRPWNYWTPDGRPYAETQEAIASLEMVLKRHPKHPGALHLWIHLWEPTDTPERAEAEADRLLPLMPGAGHIVHMPAHIFQRVGRYDDVIKVNEMAAKADEDYIAQCRAQGLYPLAYYPHNLHFIWMGASASGRSRLALESGRKLAGQVPHEALATVPILQGFLVVPYWAMVRFGEWDAILADKGPHHATAFTTGVWHYARAMAFIAKNRLTDAEQELAKLNEKLGDPSLQGPTTFSINTGVTILRIAPEVVAGEIAAKRRDWDRALLHLERAVRWEDGLIYQEPADWHAPVRQTLGAVLVEAGRPDEAEAVFWEDLRNNPENGWSLFGLAQALEAQSKKEQAAAVRARFQKAWQHADVTLTSARILR
jgi:tetratricopeptide (TPR) repeat protein